MFIFSKTLILKIIFTDIIYTYLLKYISTMDGVNKILMVAILALSLTSEFVHSDYCGKVTQWLDKTIYKPVPVYNGG